MKECCNEDAVDFTITAVNEEKTPAIHPPPRRSRRSRSRTSIIQHELDKNVDPHSPGVKRTTLGSKIKTLGKEKRPRRQSGIARETFKGSKPFDQDKDQEGTNRKTLGQNALEDDEDKPLKELATRLSKTDIKVNIKLKRGQNIQTKKGFLTEQQNKGKVEAEIESKGKIRNNKSCSSENEADTDDDSVDTDIDETTEDDWDPGNDDDENDEDDWNPACRETVGYGNKKKGNKVRKGKMKEEKQKARLPKKERRSLSHLINPEEKDDGTKWYKCTMCEKGYSTRRSMYQHLRVHEDKSLYFKCTLCSKEFAYEGGLTLHMRLHNEGEKTFKCDKCERVFLRKCDLEKHVIIHQRSLKCRCCDKEFSSYSMVRKHEREKQHAMANAYQCELCGKVLKCKSSLSHHTRHVHNDQRLHACNMCEKTYKGSKSLTLHKREKHVNEHPYHCDVCGKGWAQKCSLKAHMEIHNPNRAKPFQCQYCDARFLHKISLKSHLFNDHKEYDDEYSPFKCLICKKGFLKESDLERHLYIYSGERLCHCDVCGKQYRDAISLKQHAIRHRKAVVKKAIRCPIEGCGKYYTSKRSLAAHVKNIHPGGVNNQEVSQLNRCHKCPKCEIQTFVLARKDYPFPENPHIKGYLCDICGSIVPTEQSMIDHIFHKHS